MWRRVLRLLVASSACFLAQCSSRPMCTCGDRGLDLHFPCTAAAEQVSSIDVTGTCRLSGSQSNYVEPTGAGACHILVHFEDGTRFPLETQVRLTEGDCCGGLFLDLHYFEVPVTSMCSDEPPAADGGFCFASSPSGCFTMPGFDDCNCRCKALDVPIVGVQSWQGAGSRHCTRACGCGFGTDDLIWGCQKDSDCALVRADCCGCGEGGASTAILASHATSWDTEMSAHCGPGGVGPEGCSTIVLCGGGRAICDQGRCMAMDVGDAGH